MPAYALLLSLFLAWPAAADPETVSGIQVNGSPTFVAHSRESLSLLERSGHLALVQKYLKSIKEGEPSGTNVYTSSCKLSPQLATKSPVYLAGVIAHEAYHSKLYHDTFENWERRRKDSDGGYINEERQKQREELRAKKFTDRDKKEKIAVLKQIKDIEMEQSKIDRDTKAGDARWKELDLERRRLKVGVIEKFRNEPEFAWRGVEGERKCLLHQRQVLLDLGATPAEIASVEKEIDNPTYQGDPRSLKDYHRRWW